MTHKASKMTDKAAIVTEARRSVGRAIAVALQPRSPASSCATSATATRRTPPSTPPLKRSPRHCRQWKPQRQRQRQRQRGRGGTIRTAALAVRGSGYRRRERWYEGKLGGSDLLDGTLDAWPSGPAEPPKTSVDVANLVLDESPGLDASEAQAVLALSSETQELDAVLQTMTSQGAYSEGGRGSVVHARRMLKDHPGVIYRLGTTFSSIELATTVARAFEKSSFGSMVPGNIETRVFYSDEDSKWRIAARFKEP